MGTTWDELHKVIKVNIDTGGNFRPRAAVQTLPAALRPPCSTMQRITSLAVFRELGGLAARSPNARAWKKGSEGPAVQRQWACWCVCPKRPFSWAYRAEGQRLCRRRFVFATQNNRALCSQPGADGPRGNSDQQPFVSVVGIPDPITWIRCKVTMYLIKLYFGVDTDCVEFNGGVKQVSVTDQKTPSSWITALLSVSVQELRFCQIFFFSLCGNYLKAFFRFLKH